jgi:hypothetical protein
MTARRLGLNPPPRSPRIFDALELYAFVRPARFTAPSAAGLAQALGLPEPKTAGEQATTLRAAVTALLAELAHTPTPSREEALAIAETLARGGWAWGPNGWRRAAGVLPLHLGPRPGQGRFRGQSRLSGLALVVTGQAVHQHAAGAVKTGQTGQHPQADRHQQADGTDLIL